MTIHSAIGYSENIDESYEAGLHIAEMVQEKLQLKTSSIGILFANIEFNFKELLKGIKNELDIPILGCTTASEVNNYGYFEESASLMVITSDDIKVGYGIGLGLNKNHEKAICSAWEAASFMLDDAQPKIAITFPDNALEGSADRILKVLIDYVGKDIPIVGGIPGDNFNFNKTYQFFNGDVYTDSIPLLLLSGNIHPTVVTRSGWIRVGKKATATKAAGNILFEIDHRPAVDYLKNYIPDLDDPRILGTFPLAITEDNDDVFVIRSPFLYNKENGSVICQGDIRENAMIQMARGSREDILGGIQDAIGVLKKRTKDKTYSCLLFFSCAGRKLMLGLETEREIEILLKALPGDVFINGFYTYGEIGPIDSGLESLKQTKFHNTSVVLCAF